MNIGQFKKLDGVITGSIITLNGTLHEVAFEKITPTGEKGPDYIITTDGAELGTARLKTSKKGNSYLSVVLRSPFLPGPVFAALVQGKNNPDDYALLWSEPKAKDEPEAGEIDENTPF